MIRHLLCFILLFSVINTYGQRKPSIKGSRQPVELQENLPYFTRIEVGADVPLKIIAGEVPGYSIHADDNLVDVFRFTVTDSTLKITSFYKVKGRKTLDLEVTCPQLEYLQVTESEVEADMPKAGDLQVELGKGASLAGVLGGSYLSLDMGEDAVMDLRVGADTLLANFRERSQPVIHITQGRVLQLSMSGSSKAKFSGEIDSLSAGIADNADFLGARLESADAEVVIKDKARAEVRSTGNLYLDSSGEALTKFYGPARLQVDQFAGRSVLRKQED